MATSVMSLVAMVASPDTVLIFPKSFGLEALKVPIKHIGNYGPPPSLLTRPIELLYHLPIYIRGWQSR